MSAELEGLKYWMRLARLRDQDGLPVDLIYYVLAERNALPQVITNGTARSVNEEEFARGIDDCVSILQGRSPKGCDFSSSDVAHLKSVTA